MAYIKRIKRTDSKGRKYETVYIADGCVGKSGKKSEKLLKNLGRLGRDIDIRGAKRELSRYLEVGTSSIKPSMTFKKAIEEFSIYYEGQIGQTIKPRTYDAYLYEIRQIKDLEDVKLAKLDFTTIEKWKSDQFRLSRLSNRTINRCLISMRKVLRHAIRSGHLDKMPDWDFLKMKKGSPDAHSREEVEVLLEESESNSQLNRYLRLMLYTGIRPHEAINLQPEDLNVKEGVLEIKSDNELKRGRMIPVGKSFARIIQEWIDETGRVCPYMTTSGVQTIMARLSKKIGFTCNPKKLRATYASLMVQEDANPFRLAELMGNSVSILQKYYVAHNQKRLHDEIQKNPFCERLI